MPGQDFEELAVALAEMARDLLAQERCSPRWTA
jgi:hypothetical protein